MVNKATLKKNGNKAPGSRRKEIEKSEDKEKSRTVYRLFRKRFERLPFGEHKRNQSELTKMNHWRYCYCIAYIAEG